MNGRNGFKTQGAYWDQWFKGIVSELQQKRKLSVNTPLVVSKSMGLDIGDKVEAFRRKSKTKKAIFVTLITAMGAKKNEHYHSWIASELDVSQFMK